MALFDLILILERQENVARQCVEILKKAQTFRIPEDGSLALHLLYDGGFIQPEKIKSNGIHYSITDKGNELYRRIKELDY